MIFFERRMLVDVLYKHIRQREKVLTSKRVSLITQDHHGVTVECQDGSLYQGSILVGADGVHSTVGRHVAQASGRVKQSESVTHWCHRVVADFETRPSYTVSLSFRYIGREPLDAFCRQIVEHVFVFPPKFSRSSSETC